MKRELFIKNIDSTLNRVNTVGFLFEETEGLQRSILLTELALNAVIELSKIDNTIDEIANDLNEATINAFRLVHSERYAKSIIEYIELSGLVKSDKEAEFVYWMVNRFVTFIQPIFSGSKLNVLEAVDSIIEIGEQPFRTQICDNLIEYVSDVSSGMSQELAVELSNAVAWNCVPFETDELFPRLIKDNLSREYNLVDPITLYILARKVTSGLSENEIKLSTNLLPMYTQWFIYKALMQNGGKRSTDSLGLLFKQLTGK